MMKTGKSTPKSTDQGSAFRFFYLSGQTFSTAGQIDFPIKKVIEMILTVNIKTLYKVSVWLGLYQARSSSIKNGTYQKELTWIIQKHRS